MIYEQFLFLSVAVLFTATCMKAPGQQTERGGGGQNVPKSKTSRGWALGLGLAHNGKRAERQKWRKNGTKVEKVAPIKTGEKWPKNIEKMENRANWKIGPARLQLLEPV